MNSTSVNNVFLLSNLIFIIVCLTACHSYYKLIDKQVAEPGETILTYKPSYLVHQ